MNKIKRILVFIVLMGLVSCTQFSEAGTNQSNSAVAKKDGASVPGNMKNAYIDPDVDKESVVVVSLPSNSEILIGKRPFEKAALGARLKDLAQLFPPYRRHAYVKAAPDVEYKVLREVLDILPRSGFEYIRLVVSQSDKPEANAVFDVRLPIAQPADGKEKPYPLYLALRIESGGNLKLNAESRDLNGIKTILGEVFRDRTGRGILRDGSDEVEKTVFVDPAPDVKYGEIVKVIDALKEVGASPIAFKLDDRITEIKQVY
jgi:biopolymer transport protein ExbD